MKPIRFVFSDEPQGYDALVTVSMDYRTSPNDQFAAYPVVRHQGTRKDLVIHPDARPLAVGPRKSRTFQWVIEDLAADEHYDLLVLAGVQNRNGGYVVGFRHLVVTVEAVSPNATHE